MCGAHTSYAERAPTKAPTAGKIGRHDAWERCVRGPHRNGRSETHCMQCVKDDLERVETPTDRWREFAADPHVWYSCATAGTQSFMQSSYEKTK